MEAQKLELLAPAKDLESGKAAINHGADAVYIGASAFGARRAAGNNVSDIEALAKYAHIYNARVYVTLNTILFEDELEQARKLAIALWDAGIDALIVQDMAFMEMDLPPVPLFASTQTHNFSPEKVLFLEKAGFQRVILARELSLGQIAAIRQQTTVPLEFFVHGALCVCFSGQCYLSQAFWDRSSNRGDCAQPCRLPYKLFDNNGKLIIENKHLLSLKDLNNSNHISELINAGISSFKIEGRLKDISYIKNVSSYYRGIIDSILEGKPNYAKASSGKPFISFEPNPERSFNRGFTDHFIIHKNDKKASLDTPKSKGQYIGKVVGFDGQSFSIDTKEILRPGDGLCFFTASGVLSGFNINRVDGNKVFPNNNIFELKEGSEIFRNADLAFDKLLASHAGNRLIVLNISLSFSNEGLLANATDEDGHHESLFMACSGQLANKPDSYLENLKLQFSKRGSLPFDIKNVETTGDPLWFYPLSGLNALRRDLLDKLLDKRINSYQRQEIRISPNTYPYHQKELDFRANVSNSLAEKFYTRHGAQLKERAFETQEPEGTVPLMESRYCILGELDMCKLKDNNAGMYQEPFYLEFGKGRLRIHTDCKNCTMRLYFDK